MAAFDKLEDDETDDLAPPPFRAPVAPSPSAPMFPPTPLPGVQTYAGPQSPQEPAAAPPARVQAGRAGSIPASAPGGGSGLDLSAIAGSVFKGLTTAHPPPALPKPPLLDQISGAVGAGAQALQRTPPGQAATNFYQQHLAPQPFTLATQRAGVAKFYEQVKTQYKHPDWPQFNTLSLDDQTQIFQAYQQYLHDQSTGGGALGTSGENMIAPGPGTASRTVLEHFAPAVPKAFDETVWKPWYDSARGGGFDGPAWEQATPEQRQAGITIGMGPWAAALGPAESLVLGQTTAGAGAAAGQAYRASPLGGPTFGSVGLGAEDAGKALAGPRKPWDLRGLGTALNSTLIPGFSQETIDAAGGWLAPQGAKVLPGGKVQNARSLADQLTTFPPEDQQAIADRRLDGLSTQLQAMYAGGAPEADIKAHMVEMGKYEEARDNVVLGRDHPTTPWVDQVVNTMAEDIVHGDANVILQRGRGLADKQNNLTAGWRAALVKAVPKKADRETMLRPLEPKRAAQPAQLFEPPEPVPGPPPLSEESGVVSVGPGSRPIPQPIQDIMDEEYLHADKSTYHLTEDQAYDAARQRGTWPPRGQRQGPSSLAPSTQPPPAGRLRYHNISVTEPTAPVTPEVKKAAVALRAALDRLGLLLVGDRGADFLANPVNKITGEPETAAEIGGGLRTRYIASLRQDFVPHMVVKGPKGMSRADWMQSLATLPKSHPLNPDSPNFHQRLMDGSIFDAEKEGWQMLKDPADWFPLLVRSYQKAIANDQQAVYLKGAIARRDGRPALIKVASRQDIGNLPAPTSRVERAREKARGGDPLHGYKWVYTEELPGYYVHPDVYKSLQYQFEGPAKPIPGLTNFDQLFREVAMFNPLFHGFNQMSHHLMVSLIPGRLPLLGLKLLKDPAIMRDVASYTHLVPAQSAINDMMDVVAGKFPQTRDAMDWSDPGDYLTALGRVPAWNRKVLWNGIVRSAQAAAFVLARERYMAQGLSREEASQAAGVYADRIVGAQDPATKLRWERDGSRYMFFAYNWTKTHVMQLLESTPGLGAKVLQAEHPFLTNEAARALSQHLLISTIRGALASYAYTQLLNLAITGLDGDPKFTWENEQGREWNLDITPIVRRSPFKAATGGKRVYAASPFMRFPQWYEQYIDDVLRAGGFNRGLVSGSGEFLKNKLMAPWPAVLDATAHMVPGGQQWSSEEQATHFAGTAGSGLGGILPLSQQLTRADLSQGIAELLSGQPGLGASRLGLGVTSMLAGNNPPYYGPRSDLGQQLDPKQARAVGIWLAAHGQSPIKATPQQRADAYKEISGSVLNPTGGMAKKFQQEEQQALIDAGVSMQRQKDLQAQGRSPFEDLNVLQKEAIYKAHPDLELWSQVPSAGANPADREVDTQTKAYHLAVEDMIKLNTQAQQQDDRLFEAGQINEFTWRDHRARRLQELWGPQGAVSALKDTYPQALITQDQRAQYYEKHGRLPPGITPEDSSYQQYKAFNLDDQRYLLPDGTPNVIEWWRDRQAYLTSLPRDVQTYVEARESANRTPLEDKYEQAVRDYVNFESQHAQGALAYHTLYATSNNPLEVKLLKAKNPQLYAYTVERNIFFLDHPLAAFFFQHGRGLQKSLAAAGVSPLEAPAQQLNQIEPGLADQMLAGATGSTPSFAGGFGDVGTQPSQ